MAAVRASGFVLYPYVFVSGPQQTRLSSSYTVARKFLLVDAGLGRTKGLAIGTGNERISPSLEFKLLCLCLCLRLCLCRCYLFVSRYSHVWRSLLQILVFVLFVIRFVTRGRNNHRPLHSSAPNTQRLYHFASNTRPISNATATSKSGWSTTLVEYLELVSHSREVMNKNVL